MDILYCLPGALVGGSLIRLHCPIKTIEKVKRKEVLVIQIDFVKG